MLQIRWHGRGGQGVVTAARIFGRAAAIYGGKYAQSFPYFGTERRGAPVTAFTRLADHPIRDRSQVYEPDCVVVLDETLLESVNVLQGLRPGGIFILNGSCGHHDGLKSRLPENTVFYQIEVTPLAQEILGVPIVNTAMVGVLAAVTGWVPWEAVKKAMQDLLPHHLVEKNWRLAEETFHRALTLRQVSHSVLGKDKGEAKTLCLTPGEPNSKSLYNQYMANNSLQPNIPTPHLIARTGSWRVQRPVLDPGKCNNCLICWLFCPEGSIQRGEGCVSIDLAFCKGCGICVRECPHQALRMVDEALLAKGEGERLAGIS
ncbi:pyruvate ferredoxin oxidoreductase gamma subunit [Thermanaeromonas toyohensis ToBE]|uniref:Pyruvate ferredoxin oxidoreductase gamma subunit n=1 Tax=Thermanaeromonas toyohensis ToBE TaxID=698762 RepID=A0A1W1W0Y8_9FIRM|nr:2-oxoacid:acceptor oxidoreductase family protein [Thermanaeromonas toyohensis]SMB99287.1 pyruvate ferredoxin oxidoreductase gamma subunit [Thermanaeromonas toyohensis ToBE]